MIELYDELGRKVKFKNTKIALEKTGLSKVMLYRVSKGIEFSCKGWKSCHPSRRKMFKSWLEECAFVNIETKELVRCATVTGTQKFQKLKKLDKNHLCHLKDGKRIMTRNWVLKKTYDFIYNKNEYSTVTVISPNGIYSVNPEELKIKCYVVE